MFDLFNASYASLSSFVAINRHSKKILRKNILYFINPEYIKFVEDKDHNLVALPL
jgi:hypothetical protein